MVYSEKYNFIYIHTPRTGGSSVQSILRRFDPKCIHTLKKDSYEEHVSAMKVKDALGDRVWNGAFKFCFVRNPYSWFLSGFHSSLNYEYAKEGYKFIVNEDNQIAIPTGGIVKRTHVVVREALFQFYWQEFNKGSVRTDEFFDFHVDQGMWASDELNFVGRFESLQSDFNHISKEIGFGGVILPHLNEDEWTQRSYIELKYSEAARKLVGILYEEDIVKFGYKK